MPQFSDSSAFAKDVWLPGFNYQLEQDTGTLLNLFGGASAEDAVEVEGRRWFMKVRIGDSLGQGTIAEGGNFPTAGDTAWAEPRLELGHLAHTISVTTDELAFLDSGKAAATPIMAEKMGAAKESMTRHIERQMQMDGSGILANVASSVGATITLDATTTSQVDRDRFIWIDDANRDPYMVVHGTTGATEEARFTVSNINESTNVLTCSSADMAQATAAGVVVIDGDWASAGAFRSLEFDGLQAIIDDDNTYMGINRATAGNGWWKATVLANTGSALRSMTEALPRQLVARMARRVSTGKRPRGDDWIAFASIGVWNAYEALMTPGLRYTKSEKPDIGWGDPIPMLGIDLYPNIQTPRSTLQVVRKSSIKPVRPKHGFGAGLFRFHEKGGSIWFQANATSGQGHAAKQFAYLEGYLGLMCKRPRDNGAILDITEESV